MVAINYDYSNFDPTKEFWLPPEGKLVIILTKSAFEKTKDGLPKVVCTFGVYSGEHAGSYFEVSYNTGATPVAAKIAYESLGRIYYAAMGQKPVHGLDLDVCVGKPFEATIVHRKSTVLNQDGSQKEYINFDLKQLRPLTPSAGVGAAHQQPAQPAYAPTYTGGQAVRQSAPQPAYQHDIPWEN